MSSFQPEQYGKYLLHARIARGGMAELFRGKMIGAKGFEKIVAIKRILPHLADQQEFVKAFIDEARLAAFLQHANIVQIYDFGEMGESYYLSMEYLSGVDLKTLLRKADEANKPLKLALSLFYILPEICKGLQYAHTLKDLSGAPLNIIHRDLGPQNIFITYDGGVKLIDFGIAKATSHDATTRSGSIKGKVAYMSPEQARGERLDHRSDLFVLGLLLYELSTGHRAYTGDTYAVLTKAGKCEFIPPEDVRQGLPASLYGIINKALHKDVHLRYQSAEQMRMDLESCAKELLAAPVMGKHLSRYMHLLFADEAAREEDAIRRASLADSVADLSKPKGPLPPPPPPPAEVATSAPVRADKKISLAAVKSGTWKFHGLAPILALFLVAIAGTFFLVNISTISQAVSEGRLAELVHDSKDKVMSTLRSVVSFSEEPDPGGYQESRDPEEAARFFFESHLVSVEKLSLEDIKRLQRHGAYMQKHHPQEALMLFEGLAVQFLGVGEIHYRLGKLYADAGRLDKARENYLLASKLNPNLTESFYDLGHIFALQGEYEEAEKMFARVVDQAPPYLDEALFNLAYAQNEQGFTEDAIASLRSALKVNRRHKAAAQLLKQLTQER
ncbi:MAG: protein kinase [Desulfobulbaceae bacterium]|jgi:serine/threonine protein kinase|nr:protein kinase [Desulfobulbaceae bacterium]